MRNLIWPFYRIGRDFGSFQLLLFGKQGVSLCDVVFGLSPSAWSRMPGKAKTSKPVVFRRQPQCHDDSPKSKLNNHDRLNTHDSKFHAMVLPGHARLHVYVYIINIGSMDMVCISSHLVWHLPELTCFFSPRARRTCCQELSGLVFFSSGGPWLDAFSSHGANFRWV